MDELLQQRCSNVVFSSPNYRSNIVVSPTQRVTDATCQDHILVQLMHGIGVQLHPSGEQRLVFLALNR